MKFNFGLISLAAAVTAVQAAAVAVDTENSGLAERLTSFVASDEFQAGAKTGDDLDLLVNFVADEIEDEDTQATEGEKQKRSDKDYKGGKDDGDGKFEIDVKGEVKNEHGHGHEHGHEHGHKHGHGHQHKHGHGHGHEHKHEHKHKHEIEHHGKIKHESNHNNDGGHGGCCGGCCGDHGGNGGGKKKGGCCGH